MMTMTMMLMMMMTICADAHKLFFRNQHGIKLDSIRTQDMSIYSWDEALHTQTNTKNHIMMHGEVLDVKTGSADCGVCTCTHYTNKVAFSRS